MRGDVIQVFYTLLACVQLSRRIEGLISEPGGFNRLRSVLNHLHGLDLFGDSVPKSYAPRLHEHRQLLQHCTDLHVAEQYLRDLRQLIHYTEQRWQRGRESRVIQALTASFKAFTSQPALYPGSVANLKPVYEACHARSFGSKAEPRLARNVQRLAELDSTLAARSADEREAARDTVLSWIRQEEGEMSNTSYDRVGQALEAVAADVFCDAVQKQLQVTLTAAERSAFTVLHELTEMDDFIDWGAEE